MFPRLKQRFGTAVLDRVDLLVELSTLGEYGLAEDGLPVQTEELGRPSATPLATGCQAPRLAARARTRDDCPLLCAPTPKRREPPARP